MCRGDGALCGLIPALSQQVAATVLTFLFGIAGSIGVIDIEQQLREVLGAGDEPSPADEGGSMVDAPSDPSAGADAVADEAASEDELDDDVRVGHDAINALQAVLNGPALQILPLGLCV